jgi:hypothetical protein
LSQLQSGHPASLKRAEHVVRVGGLCERGRYNKSGLWGIEMKRVVAPLLAAVVSAIALAIPASAIPDQGTPAFDEYMQGLDRNGYHLNPDTAWRVAHQACMGGIPGYIGLELAAQGVIGPGAQERVFEVARKYACPVQ